MTYVKHDTNTKNEQPSTFNFLYFLYCSYVFISPDKMYSYVYSDKQLLIQYSSMVLQSMAFIY